MRSGRSLIVACVVTVALALASCGQQSVGSGAVGSVTSVRIARVNTLPANHIPPFQATSYDAAAARSLAHTVETLPAFPSGPISCPNDIGESYTLTFLSGSSVVMTATVNATGCQGLNITGESQARWTATGPFWPQLAQTFHVTQTSLSWAPQP